MSLFSPSFSCGAKIDEYIYASAYKYNALIKVKIEDGKTEYVREFPNSDIVIENQHSRAFVHSNKVFFAQLWETISIFLTQVQTILKPLR